MLWLTVQLHGCTYIKKGCAKPGYYKLSSGTSDIQNTEYQPNKNIFTAIFYTFSVYMVLFRTERFYLKANALKVAWA